MSVDLQTLRPERNLPPPGNKREGSGEWVKLVERVEEHQCRLPGTFAKEPGSQWRCDCGKVWIVVETPPTWSWWGKWKTELRPLEPGTAVIVVPSE